VTHADDHFSRNAEWGEMTEEDRLIPLRKAAEIFLGDAKHVATLRAEAARGNLVVSKIGRGYWTTLARLKAMDEKCQGDHLARNSGSIRSEIPGPSSMVDPVIAQGAALRTLNGLKQHFGITSKQNTNRPSPKRRSLQT
jgi:hypothetical protein